MEDRAKPMKCKQVKSGEWVQPVRRNYIMQCCDCGLIHRLNFRIVKDKRGRNFIQFQAFRATHKEAKALTDSRKKQTAIGCGS